MQSLFLLLERVDFYGLNSVQIQTVLIAASLCRPSGLSQKVTTKSTMVWVEPYRQRLFGIYAVFSLIYVE
ncbi:hypothetical protein CWC15_04245 [Pseudoalteromonas spongiae]|nr:hypothetical protein CWC15_04245 [Pseudoalteromonas spongiae]